MSRSFKKTPITGIASCASEKQDKKISHKIARRSVKQLLSIDPENFTHIDRRAFRFNNVWAFGKDGKCYYGHLKNVERSYFEKLTRK